MKMAQPLAPQGAASAQYTRCPTRQKWCGDHNREYVERAHSAAAISKDDYPAGKQNGFLIPLFPNRY